MNDEKDDGSQDDTKRPVGFFVDPKTTKEVVVYSKEGEEDDAAKRRVAGEHNVPDSAIRPMAEHGKAAPALHAEPASHVLASPTIESAKSKPSFDLRAGLKGFNDRAKEARSQKPAPVDFSSRLMS